MAAGGLEGQGASKKARLGSSARPGIRRTLVMLPDAGQEGREPGPLSRSSWAAT